MKIFEQNKPEHIFAVLVAEQC